MLVECAEAQDPRVIRLGFRVLLIEVPKTLRGFIGGGRN